MNAEFFFYCFFFRSQYECVLIGREGMDGNQEYRSHSSAIYKMNSYSRKTVIFFLYLN